MKINKALLFSVMFFLVFAAPLPAKNKSEAQPQNYGNFVHSGYRLYPYKTNKPTVSMLKKNDRIDILAALEMVIKDGSKEKGSVTLLQDVRVLDILEAGGENYLLLQLAPLDAKYLALFENEELKIILRSAGDRQLFPIPVSKQSKTEIKKGVNLNIVKEDSGVVKEIKPQESYAGFIPSASKLYPFKVSAKVYAAVNAGDFVYIKLDGVKIGDTVSYAYVLLKKEINGQHYLMLNLSGQGAQTLFLCEYLGLKAE